jgi:hypothetical protein
MTDVLLGTGTAGHAGRPRQHASHRQLANRAVTPSRRAPIDAILVPAARDVARLVPAVRLAEQLGCPVVVLCSSAAQAAKIRAIRWAAIVIAVDVRDKSDRLPLLTTAMLDGTRFARASDTSVKRNLGLALTRVAGWQRVLFLDDDITGLEAAVIERAASLLDDFGTVALDNLGYPDNSVVCHANRDTGGEQSTFVGAGAMLFPASRATAFFPDIYNEDWFFLLEGERITDVAVHGTFEQAPYDPYANPKRAGDEEFGDCLAEGIFALLDNGAKIGDADRRYWRDFLAEREALIDAIIRRSPGAHVSTLRRQRIAAALRASKDSLRGISPEMCVRYLDNWRIDRARWHDYIENLPQGLPVERALDLLKLRLSEV